MWKRDIGGGWSKFAGAWYRFCSSRISYLASSQWMFSNEVKRSSSRRCKNRSRLMENFKKMSKTSHKVTFSKLRNVETGRGDLNEKLKFLTYFWKPSLNLWVRWFLNATKSQIFSCSIQGTVWISIGKSNNFPLIIHSAQRACRVTVVFLIL